MAGRGPVGCSVTSGPTILAPRRNVSEPVQVIPMSHCNPEITIIVYQFRADDGGVAGRRVVVEGVPPTGLGSFSLIQSDHKRRDRLYQTQGYQNVS